MAKRLGTGLLKAQMQEIQSTIAMNGSRLTNVKGIEMNVYSDEVSADGTGGFGDTTGLVVPANSIITGMGVVTTTQLGRSTTLTVGVNFGTTVDGHEMNVVDANGFVASGSGNIAVGVGTSTHSHEKTALGGAATIVFDPDVAYSASERTIYGSVTVDTGNLTGGGVVFWVTYRLVA